MEIKEREKVKNNEKNNNDCLITSNDLKCSNESCSCR